MQLNVDVIIAYGFWWMKMQIEYVVIYILTSVLQQISYIIDILHKYGIAVVSGKGNRCIHHVRKISQCIFLQDLLHN